MSGEKLCTGTIKLERIAVVAVSAILLVFMLILTAYALYETTSISMQNAAGELAECFEDNIFLNALALALILPALYIFYRHRDDISLRRIEIILVIWIFVLGTAFILSVKLCAPWYTDSYYVTAAAMKAAKNDYSALENYFVRFPFQLGFVMYEELFFRVCLLLLPNRPTGYYCLALQGVNLLWLMLAYHSLIKLSGHLFYSIRVQKMTALLMIFCLPAVLTCTFIYGNIPAFSLGIFSTWMLAEFLDRKKFLYALLCALTLGVSVLLKLNLMIFFVAFVIILVFELIRSFSVKSLICLALTAVSVFSVSKLPQTVYEARSGREFGSGIPMIAWMAMGFSEGHAGPGWYKEDNTVTFFANSGNDPEATAENAKTVIKSRISYFVDNPSEGLRFFLTKFKSQWNEPTYESIWVNQVQASYGEKKGLYKVFCTDGSKTAIELMNQYQQVIFIGVLIAALLLMRSAELKSCLPAIIIIGGMLYHLLFEAKSQYCLPYFIMMIPLAAYGLCGLFFKISKR